MRQSADSTELEHEHRVGRLSAILARLYFDARRDYSIDLSHRAIRVLQLAAFRGDPPRIDDVARQLGCATSTASELVKRLQSKGLLVRRRSDIDERVVELYLTNEGEAALLEHTTLDMEKLKSGLSALSVREQDELIRLVGELTEGIGGLRDD
jgi:DNA-binding MarR family transcriptional regulator